eukprot:1043814-Prymnesium_polylepis.2
MCDARAGLVMRQPKIPTCQYYRLGVNSPYFGWASRWLHSFSWIPPQNNVPTDEGEVAGAYPLNLLLQIFEQLLVSCYE